MVPKTIHEYESTHAAKEHGLTKSATSPIQKVRKILDTTDGYAIAREHLRKKGAQIAIDHISPSAIGLVNIAFLEAQIAKLNWSAEGEEDLYSRQEIVDRLRRNGI